jgi:hypothetical protein
MNNSPRLDISAIDFRKGGFMFLMNFRQRPLVQSDDLRGFIVSNPRQFAACLRGSLRFYGFHTRTV